MGLLVAPTALTWTNSDRPAEVRHEVAVQYQTGREAEKKSRQVSRNKSLRGSLSPVTIHELPILGHG